MTAGFDSSGASAAGEGGGSSSIVGTAVVVLSGTDGSVAAGSVVTTGGAVSVAALAAGGRMKPETARDRAVRPAIPVPRIRVAAEGVWNGGRVFIDLLRNSPSDGVRLPGRAAVMVVDR